MKPKSVACVALFLVGVSSAYAESHSTAFVLDGLMPLDSDTAVSSGVGNVGRWSQRNAPMASGSIRWDVNGVTQSETAPIYTATGWSSGSSSWPSLGTSDVALHARQPFADGSMVWTGSASQSDGVHNTSTAVFGDGYMQATTSLESTQWPASAETAASWHRLFELNAHSSLSLRGRAVFDDASPEASTSTFSLPDFRSAALDVTGTGGGVSLRAYLGDPSTFATQQEFINASAFSYSVDPAGWISLTVANRSNEAMVGQFNVGIRSIASNIPAVPEPSTWLSLAVGLGAMGWVSNRGRKTLG